MRYLHTMIRVKDVDAAIEFFGLLGLREVRRRDSEKGRFTLVFLSTDSDPDSPQLELTHNWDQDESYSVGRNFGHVAYEVDDIYAACQTLMDAGVTINRPPRDGRMAFVRSPDLILGRAFAEGTGATRAGAVGVHGQHRRVVDGGDGVVGPAQKNASGLADSRAEMRLIQ